MEMKLVPSLEFTQDFRGKVHYRMKWRMKLV